MQSFEETDEAGRSHFITLIVLDVDKVDSYVKELWFDAVILTLDLSMFETQNELQHALSSRHLAGLELWLEALQELYPRTPVMLVGTKAEQVKSSSTFSLTLKSLEELLDKGRVSHMQKFANYLCSTCFLCTSKGILSRCLNIKSTSKFNISCIDFSLSSTYGSVTAPCLMKQSIESSTPINNPNINFHHINYAQLTDNNINTLKNFPHVIGYYEIDSKKCFPKESKKQNPSLEHLRKAILRHFASDNCLYSLRKNGSNIPEKWLAFIKHLNSTCTIHKSAASMLVYDEIVSICRSFDIVFWQIPLLLRYCEKRGRLIVLQSPKLSLKYILINIPWLKKLEFKIIENLQNDFINKINLKRLIFEIFKSDQSLFNSNLLEPASLNHLIRHRLCLNKTCIESSNHYYLFLQLLKVGECHCSVWTAVPDKYEKQLTYELFIKSNPSEFFIDIIEIIIGDKGKEFLNVLCEPVPVIYQRQIVFFMEIYMDSCENCREIFNENKKLVCISHSKDCTNQEAYASNKYHKIKLSLNHKGDKLRVCVRGSRPCCIMKKLIEFLYLHIEEWIDSTKTPKKEKIKKAINKADRKCDIEYPSVEVEKTFHYVLCPKCVIFQKSNPKPIFFRGVSIKRKPVCDYWHHLGSWTRAVTGSYKTIPIEIICNEISDQSVVPDYEVPRLIMILPPSRERCKDEWISKSYARFMEGFEIQFLCESPNEWHPVDGCCFRLTPSMCENKSKKQNLTSLISLAFLLVQIIQAGNEFNNNLKLLLPLANIFMQLPEYSGIFEHEQYNGLSQYPLNPSYDSYMWMITNKSRLVSLLTKILMTLGDGLPDLFYKNDQSLNSENIFQVPTFASRKEIAEFLNLELISGRFANLRPIYLGRELRWVCSKHYYDLHSNSSLKYFP